MENNSPRRKSIDRYNSLPASWFCANSVAVVCFGVNGLTFAAGTLDASKLNGHEEPRAANNWKTNDVLAINLPDHNTNLNNKAQVIR